MKKRREAPILIIGNEKLEVEVINFPAQLLTRVWRVSGFIGGAYLVTRLIGSELLWSAHFLRIWKWWKWALQSNSLPISLELLWSAHFLRIWKWWKWDLWSLSSGNGSVDQLVTADASDRKFCVPNSNCTLVSFTFVVFTTHSLCERRESQGRAYVVSFSSRFVGRHTFPYYYFLP